MLSISDDLVEIAAPKQAKTKEIMKQPDQNSPYTLDKQIQEKKPKINFKDSNINEAYEIVDLDDQVDLEEGDHIEIITKNCFVVINFKQSGMYITVLGSEPPQKLKKLVAIIQSNHSQPSSPFYHLMSGTQAKKFFQDPGNVKVNLQQNYMIAIWSIVAGSYVKYVQTRIDLTQKQINKMERLQYQIYILKKKLERFEKNNQSQNGFVVTQKKKNELVVRPESIKYEFKEQQYSISERNNKSMEKSERKNENKVQRKIQRINKKLKDKQKNFINEPQIKDVQINQQEGKDKIDTKKKKQKVKTDDFLNQTQEKNKTRGKKDLSSESESLQKEIKQEPKKRGRKKIKNLDTKGKDSHESISQEQDIDRIYSGPGNNDLPYLKTFVGEKVRLDFQNGDFYFGDFQRNKYNGNGKYFTKQTGQTYFGEWKNGFPNGYGEITDLDGNSFTGHFRDGRREGKGIDSYQNGEKYVGEFKGNAKNGFGTYYYLNKDYYEGFWKDDKCHGKGKETYKDGSFFEGQWIDDEKNGFGVMTKNGKKFKQYWKNGVQISSKMMAVRKPKKLRLKDKKSETQNDNNQDSDS